jgi:peptide/nickel transport system permease protein
MRGTDAVVRAEARALGAVVAPETAALAGRAGRRRGAALGAVLTSRGVRGAFLMLAGVTALVLVAPLLAPYGTSEIVPAGPLHAPSLHNLFGTDEIGRDVFSRVLDGIRTSWLAALAVIALGAAFGGLVGALAGAAGGVVDLVLMRTTDLFLALPAPVLAIAVIASLGPSLTHTLIALSIVWWPWYARIVRAEVRALAARPHADAARVAGVGRLRMIFRHLLPGALPPVIVTMSLDVGNLVLALAGLSFIGLGAPPPSPELGAMSASGLAYLLDHPWVSVVPGLTVAFLAFSANLAGDGLARLLHHRERTPQ